MPLLRLLLALARSGVVRLAALIPVDSPAWCMALSALLGLSAACLLPGLEASARAMPAVAAAFDGFAGGWRWLRAAEAAMGAGALAGVALLQARCLQLCLPEAFEGPGGPAVALFGFRGRRSGLVLAGMPIAGDDLRTSVLVTGVTGSSKTAGVLLPLVSRLFAAYSRETAEENSPDEFQKLGAFIPEVKGDLVDACIYLAHEAGRCVSRDILVLTPASRIPVVRYRDERGRRWHLSGRGGAGGSDAGELLPELRFPAGHPRAGRRVAGGIFERPEELRAVEAELRRGEFVLRGRRPRFIGWRWRERDLARVSHTEARERPVWLPGRRAAAPPLRLAFEGVEYVDNGLHYNLVDPRLPAVEAAERLTRLAALARGGGPRGENDYFYEQGRKVIAACIALHRATEPEPCTAADIVRLATQNDRLAAALERLEARIGSLGGAPGPEAAREKSPLEHLALFFREEWQKMVADGKTANVIKSTISAAFDVFLQDADLAETFCRPSTFSFEDLPQEGKIIGLVPGDRYEQLGRLIGTACKLDFQSTLLSRNGRSDLNSARLVLYCADECHKYATGGSATAGDPYFMNLSRSNNVVNLCATQSYAWIVEVIGREAANVYISAFGVQFWLQQTDPETCRRAAEICGTVVRSRASLEQDFNLAALASALGGGRALAIRRRTREEREERIRAEDFARLDVGEIVAYNKGRPGRAGKVARGRAEYLPCTRRPAGPAAVNARVREYYREVIENLTHQRGEGGRWDGDAGEAAA
ncbi:MAG TPA: TraM recognition domain-containing protein [Opitutaceae bacterium]|nr:TraM recognition domain-containing protein [Opitutaceae bacterium]